MIRLGIFTGSFPNLSETFIIRKVAWLSRQSGLSINVYAKRADKVKHLKQAIPGVQVHYLPPFQGLQHPITFLKALGALFRYGPFTLLKAWKNRNIVQYAPLPAFAKLMRVLPFQQSQLDLLHFEFLSQGVTGSWIADLHRIPFVVSCRGSEINNFPDKPQREQELILDVLRKAGRIHCVSVTMAEKVKALLPENMHTKVFVNFPAIDPGFYTPVQHQAKEVCKLIAVGRLEWVKGFDHLLQALRLLKEAGVPFQFELVGDGPLRNQLQFSIEDLGLQEHIKLLGPKDQEEVRNLLQTADIFVLSSHSEGISNAVLEAMAAGLAVLCTRCGGMHEVITHLENGYLAEVRDCEGWAMALAELCKDASLRSRLGKAARASVELHHNLEAQASTFHRHYKELLV